ncbi:hypothetical protein [Paenibacillus albus]|uniref:Peptide ABC transporter permease n=1 Tax=Paenibacillus albus TaxID=2495582 RepID=A0A3S9A7Y5_9BACL|nr:hypothetical protein [Paenibacillus albus]AZN41867.1 hypothetical protein EJC50_20960 [Paenibacillus albus]
MVKRKNIWDLIYVSREGQENCFYSYGIEFHEFISCIFNRPENILLLRHQFFNAQWNQHSRFDYVTKQELDELIQDNVYGYGDFCWVDFSEEEDLDALNNNQIAELLFFGHLEKPLHNIPKVRFAYYAHDDGWFNKLYVTYLHDYEILLAKIITSKLYQLTGRKIADIPADISSVLLDFTKNGLFINLSRVINSKVELKIPITTVGHYTDMDRVYKLREEISDDEVWLVYSKRLWKLAPC